MRVHRIDLYSNDHEVARFDTDGPNRRNPYVLKNVTGLDAEQITPQFYGQGAVSDIKFTSLALEPREVVMRVGLQPDWSVGNTPADLRSNLLKAIASNRSGLIQLRFYENEVVIGVLDGFVNKFTDSPSAKESEVIITVKCDNPLIRSMDVTSQILTGLSVSAPVLIDPISTAPHGFKFKLTITSDMTPPWGIQDSATPDWKFQLNNVLLDNDELYFSSEENDKYLYLVRSAVTYHLMDQLELGSLWPIMFPGENTFDILGGSSFVWNEVYWYETHWGI